MKRPRGAQPTDDGRARLTDHKRPSPWNARRCVCGEAFDDHVHFQNLFPCARPYCGCRDFKEAK